MHKFDDLNSTPCRTCNAFQPDTLFGKPTSTNYDQSKAGPQETQPSRGKQVTVDMYVWTSFSKLILRKSLFSTGDFKECICMQSPQTLGISVA